MNEFFVIPSSFMEKFDLHVFITNYSSVAKSLIEIISKYQIRPLYNLPEIDETLGKIKERICSSSVTNSSNNSEPNLFKKLPKDMKITKIEMNNYLPGYWN